MTRCVYSALFINDKVALKVAKHEREIPAIQPKIQQPANTNTLFPPLPFILHHTRPNYPTPRSQRSQSRRTPQPKGQAKKTFRHDVENLEKHSLTPVHRRNHAQFQHPKSNVQAYPQTLPLSPFREKFDIKF